MRVLLLVITVMFLLLVVSQNPYMKGVASAQDVVKEEVKKGEDSQGEAKKPEISEESLKQIKTPQEATTGKEGSAAAETATTDTKAREIPPEVLKQFGREQKLPEGARLEVFKAMLTVNGEMLDVRYRVVGLAGVKSFDRKLSYIMNESTGDKFAIASLAKIGPLGPRRLRVSPQGITGISYFLVQHGGKVKKGDQVTIAIGELKQEHVLVEE